MISSHYNNMLNYLISQEWYAVFGAAFLNVGRWGL